MNINNYEENRILDGSASADSIVNYSYADSVSIYAYSGDDKILNGSNDVYIEAGKGNDSIWNEYDNCDVTILGGAGNDTVTGYLGDNSSVDGGADNDLISLAIYQDIHNSTYDTILDGAGNDTIHLTRGASYYYFRIKVDGGDNDDSIVVDNSDSDWYRPDISINGGNGNDTITSDGDYSTLIGGDGNDYIYNLGNSVSLDGGAGNDFISLESGVVKNTITGGTGNDTIILANQNHVVKYASGDGNDIVEGFNRSDTLHITSGSITRAGIIGDDAVIYIGSNYITLKDAAERTLNLQIGGSQSFSTVFSDTISGGNGGNNTTGGGTDTSSGGNDTTTADTLPAGWRFTSNAATATLKNVDDLDLNEEYGENIIKVDGSKTTIGVEIIGNDLGNSIKGGKGNDTITGGYGDDTVSLGAGSDIYIYTGGYDIIQDYTAGYDSIMISIDDLEDISVETIGTDVILYTNEGTVTVKKAAGKNITWIGATPIIPPYNLYPQGWKYDSEKQLLQATVATAENEIDLMETYGEEIIKVDGSKISGGVDIYGNDLDNSIKGGKGNDILDGGEGDDTLTSGTGDDIFIYSGGNDYITDYVAGKDSIQIDITEIEIIGVDTIGSNVVYYTGAGDLTVKGGKGKEITLIDADGNPISFGSVIPEGWKIDSAKKLLQATVSSAENYIDLNETYGEGIEKVDDSKISGGVEIYGNDLNNSIKGGKGNDVLDGGAGHDTLTGGSGDDVFIYTGGEDYITDYVADHDSIQIEIDNLENITAETVGSNVVYTTDEGILTVAKGKGKDIVLMDTNGDRIIIDDLVIPEGWKLDTAKKLLQATVASADNEIDLSEDYGEGIEKVDANKITSGVVIYGNDLNNSIKGSKGADTINGGEGNDTLTGGSGDDVFIYSGGDDYITDYTAGHDSIQIEIDNVEDIAVATVGSNVIYTTDEGTLTVAKGKDKNITLMDSNGDIIVIGGGVTPNGWKLDTAKQLLQATVASAENEIDLTENYGDGIVKVDGSKITGGVEIYGNDLNNSLKGGKGNDVLDGGAGNDTLTSGTGDDIFIYSGGDDYITDYTAGKDSIQIDTEEIEITGVETVSSNVIYYTDAGNITVKGGKGKDITLIDANENLIVIGGSELPNGWKFDSAKKLLQATVATAENEIDLTESYGEGVEKVDGSKITGGVEIIGNDNGNSIKGGKGADIITGGTGNDTVSLGGGADVYIYTGGDDLIQDYATVDAIQMNTDEITINDAATISSNVIYYTDAGNITVKGGKNKQITLIDSNGAEFTYSNSKLAEDILFMEDNFISEETNLDSVTEITQDNYSVQNIEAKNYLEIEQPILTYSNDK